MSEQPLHSASTGGASPDAAPPGGAEFPIPVLEDDETVPPRPEEDLADVERAQPDPH